MSWLSGKRIWITGASSGIGRALAVAAAGRGARVVLSGRNVDRLEEVADLVGRNQAEIVPFDVSSEVERRQALTTVGRKPLDALINNAGVSQRSLAAETKAKVYHALLETNLASAIELSLGVIALLRQQGGGRIAAVSSIAGELYGPQRSGYSATKAGMNAFFYALRTELWEEKIPVTVVIPGFIRTEVSRNAFTGDGGNYGKMDSIQATGMEPEKAAERILDALEAGRRSARVGMTLKLWYGLLVKTVAPGLFDRVMRKAKVT